MVNSDQYLNYLAIFAVVLPVKMSGLMVLYLVVKKMLQNLPFNFPMLNLMASSKASLNLLS